MRILTQLQAAQSLPCNTTDRPWLTDESATPEHAGLWSVNCLHINAVIRVMFDCSFKLCKQQETVNFCSEFGNQEAPASEVRQCCKVLSEKQWLHPDSAT
ncbi:hypothetical protein CVIRNUC_009499 [Coccomyxa viridis]|uniref:Uncharacterized protein n=1 Tax=Coccomyxa viridis TaxID=1274662 RepID=A0AAV1IG48_9CHLO|nr:hypothetical protein CVIRNUC_009499 [Coccomyxa viridis]